MKRKEETEARIAKYETRKRLYLEYAEQAKDADSRLHWEKAAHEATVSMIELGWVLAI
jgi:hypothetical protein